MTRMQIWIILILILMVIGYMKVKSRIDTILDIMASAIEDWEGGEANNLNMINNNPGNIRYFGNLNSIPWIGAVGVDKFNHVIFATYQDGRNALIKQLRMAFNNTSSVYNSAMNLYDFFSHYAEANSKQYAEFVAKKLGVFAFDTLDQIAKG